MERKDKDGDDGAKVVGMQTGEGGSGGDPSMSIPARNGNRPNVIFAPNAGRSNSCEKLAAVSFFKIDCSALEGGLKLKNWQTALGLYVVSKCS